jgi:hypothetical protein
VPSGTWHALRVEFSGETHRRHPDGKSRIDVGDDHVVGQGAVGVRTKADSITAFDAFAYGAKHLGPPRYP